MGALELLLGGLCVLLVTRFLVSGQIGSGGLQAWETVFIAICVQAIPFVVLGTVVSAAVAALVPPSFLERLLPKRPSLAVPIAGAAGALLPGCECASIPVASRLMAGGVAPAASLAFLLSAPAINPVVLTATAVAFPGQPQMVWARLIASLLASVAMGWLWAGLGRPEWLRPQLREHEHHEGGRLRSFLAALEHDFLQSAGFLVVGALMAATLNVLVPRSLLAGVGSVPVLNLLVLGLLAVVLAICSEADAFVAASLTAVSPVARLAFLVVGPMVDVKLISLQAGTFGRAFAWRFSAATFVVALACAGLVGGWLL
ncbi:permease [Streptacidiphilus sp. MAP12-20]|uniref:permease n=1 Tax=Streptacidiphilus sp. MAP12-20 TaxID=3156299 RepID=UPI00351377C7